MDASGDQILGLMVLGDFPSGPFAMFTGPGTLDYDGNSYFGAGNFLSIGEASSSAGDEKGGLTITLSGASDEVIAIAETEEFQRRRVTVRLGLFGSDGALIDSDVFFDGLADTLDTNDDPEGPSVTLACEQRALDLGRARPFRYTPEDQKSRHPGDTFFDLVQKIQTREPTWGK
ncbi:MAG: hypothetical protein ABNG97_05895 [Sulfitobacter sp.]|jgi:hypothetical protein